MSILNNNEIPIGFGMALAQDLDALKAFSALSDAERGDLLSRARNAKSKAEMQKLVMELAKGL